MDVTIDVYDFADQDEIKEVVLDEVRNIIRNNYGKQESGLDRLLTNLSYQYVFDMVNEQIDEDLSQFLKCKIVSIIEDLSSYSVFKKADAWDRESSKAYKILQEEIGNSRPLIKARVHQIIAEYPFSELEHDEIGEVIRQCVMDKLFGGDGV